MSFHKHEEKKVIIYTKMQIDKGDTWIIPYEDNDSPYWKFEYNNGSFFLLYQNQMAIRIQKETLKYDLSGK